jgi:hypothetical protein
MKRRLAFALLALSLSAPLFASTGPDDRVIDPTERVGAVTPDSTEEEILRVYGSSNVTTSPDGLFVVVFLGKPDEVRVDFKSPHRNPERVSIGASSGAWATPSGLHVGTTIDELEKINGGPFDITGVNWQIPARVVSWRGGALPPTLFVDLEPQTRLDDETRKKLTSQKTFFDSSNKAFQTFVVRRIVLEW